MEEEKNTLDLNADRPVIEVRDFYKSWPGYYLMIPELNIPSGVVGLLGESGSGKTTLLNSLATLDPKYYGDIFLNGVRIEQKKEQDLLRATKFSFLFQSSNLIQNFKVIHNLQLSRDIRSVIGDAADPEDIISSLFRNYSQPKLSALLKKYASELSGGQKQRVAVARALVKARDGAELLFADEPTANIDKGTAEDCINQLVGWARQENNAIVLASHDLSIARSNTDHLILIGLADESRRMDLISHFKSIGVKESELPSKDDDNVFTVVEAGPTAECVERIVEALVERKSISKPFELTVKKATFKKGLEFLCSQLAFLFSYCWRDVFRWRESVYNLIRGSACTFLFVVIILSSSILVGVPRIADELFRNDPLLRLVEVQSIANFPITEKAMFELRNLVITNEIVHAKLPPNQDKEENLLNTPIGQDESLDSSTPLVAGVVPRRTFSFQYYESSGKIRKHWVDGGLWVHGVGDSGDPIFEFWGLEPLTEIDGVMVHEKLITDLGFELHEFQSKIDDPNQEALLYVNVFEKVPIRVDKIVSRFPDPDVEILIPAELANQIRLNMRAAETHNVPFLLIRGHPDMTSAQEDQKNLRDRVHEFMTILSEDKLHTTEGSFYIQAERVSIPNLEDSKPEFHVMIRPPISLRDDGLPVKTWERISGLYGGEYQVHYGKLPSRINEMRPPPVDANNATMFVNDYRDIPKIIEYIDSNNDELRLRISNRKSKETITTVEKGTRLLAYVIGAIAIVFTLISLLCLLFSFMPQVQNKLGEMGILRAYGSRRSFIYCRFLLEILVTCIAGFVFATAICNWLVLPKLNQFAATQLPDLFAAVGDGPLLYEIHGVGGSLVVIVIAMLLVAGLIHSKLKKAPADLLRMAD